MKRITTGIALCQMFCVSVFASNIVGQDQVVNAKAASGALPVGQCPDEYLESYGPFVIYSSCNCDGGDCIAANGLMGFYDFPETGCNPDGTCKFDSDVAAVVKFDDLKILKDGKTQQLELSWTGKPPTLEKGVDLETPFRNFYVNKNDQVVRSRFAEQYFKHFNNSEGKAIGYKKYRGVLTAKVDGGDVYFIAVRSYIDNFPVKMGGKVQQVRLKFYVALQLAEKPGDKVSVNVIQAEYGNGQLKIVDENSEINGASFSASLVTKLEN